MSIHYSNPYTRNDIPTFLKQLFPKPNKAKAGSNYQEAKHTQNKIFVNTRGQRTEPLGGGVAPKLKVAAGCKSFQHPQTQTKENFINRSWFSIKPSTTGRSPTGSPAFHSSFRTVAAGVRRHRPPGARTRRGRSPTPWSPSNASDPTPFRTQGAAAAPHRLDLYTDSRRTWKYWTGRGPRHWASR